MLPTVFSPDTRQVKPDQSPLEKPIKPVAVEVPGKLTALIFLCLINNSLVFLLTPMCVAPLLAPEPAPMYAVTAEADCAVETNTDW